MRIILICIFILVSGCAKDYDLNPWTTVLKQIHKASYDEKRVRPLETFKEKHTAN
jgi:hypothetical protein